MSCCCLERGFILEIAVEKYVGRTLMKRTDVKEICVCTATDADMDSVAGFGRSSRPRPPCVSDSWAARLSQHWSVFGPMSESASLLMHPRAIQRRSVRTGCVFFSRDLIPIDSTRRTQNAWPSCEAPCVGLRTRVRQQLHRPGRGTEVSRAASQCHRRCGIP